MAKRDPLVIGSTEVAPGRKRLVELPVARLFTGTDLSLTVVVLHGREPGPNLWLNAAIHGNELNGIRIIRDSMQQIDVRKLRGTILAVPVVNVFGLIHHSRYLPDRRDLNRSFPGSPKGSLASRLAYLFVQEVVRHCDFGLDLHTAGPNRNNLPHIRTDLSDPESRRLAEAFGASLIFSGASIQGSLRKTAQELGKRMLVYEAGEPLRFNRKPIEVGTAGVRRVLDVLGMYPAPDIAPPPKPVYGGQSVWVRAGRSGVFNARIRLGDTVVQGAELGSVSDPFPQRGRKIKAPFSGVVMGITVNPLVHQGDALMHLVEVIGSEPAPVNT